MTRRRPRPSSTREVTGAGVDAGTSRDLVFANSGSPIPAKAARKAPDGLGRCVPPCVPSPEKWSICRDVRAQYRPSESPQLRAFPVFVYEDAGEGWVYAHVPELPEVQIQGENREQTRVMVLDTISMVLAERGICRQLSILTPPGR